DILYLSVTLVQPRPLLTCTQTFASLAHYDFIFFFSSRRRHTRSKRDWSSDVCSSDLPRPALAHRRESSLHPDCRSAARSLYQSEIGRESCRGGVKGGEPADALTKK